MPGLTRLVVCVVCVVESGRNQSEGWGVGCGLWDVGCGLWEGSCEVWWVWWVWLWLPQAWSVLLSAKVMR